MTTTEHAADIRRTLKARGITSRSVSVRADYYSMGSAIRVRIVDPTVSSSLVQSIAEAHERIDRDHFGEILSGGNRFVTVSYDHGTLAAMGATYRPAVDAAIATLPVGSHSLQPVEGTPFLVGRDNYSGFGVWEAGSGHLQSCYDADAIAQDIAVRMVNRAAERE